MVAQLYITAASGSFQYYNCLIKFLIKAQTIHIAGVCWG